MLPRKQLSGYEKKKRKERTENLIKTQKGAIHNYFSKRAGETSNGGELGVDENDLEHLSDENPINEDAANLNAHDNVPNSTSGDDVGIDDHLVPPLDFYYPMNWGNLDNRGRDVIV